ncbi:MAG: hypothetical protein O9340_08685 [Cyclobacteriaceae bacterium]|jgi:hypothetical protein|nr:hypothetical protein [Cyclobacteriaceae bacterium]
MTVAHYIVSLPEKQKQLMTILRSWILDISAEVKESMHEELQEPTFYLHGALCYLTKDNNSVSIHFYQGKKLAKQFEELEMEDRKQMASYTFYGINGLEEHEDEVRKWLTAAAALQHRK